MKYPTNSKFKNTPVLDDEDDGDAIPSNIRENYLGYSKRQMPITSFSFSIDEPILGPKYYRQVVEELQNLGENDEVQIRINSPGGQLDGLVTLVEAIRMTDADVLAIITGRCHSAASMLALSCPNVAVTPNANMMIHYVSFGSVGKAADIVGHVQHTTKYAEMIFRRCYRNFLTETEMQEVIAGKEIWLLAEEIEQRLEKRQALNIAEMESLSEAQAKSEVLTAGELAEEESIQVPIQRKSRKT